MRVCIALLLSCVCAGCGTPDQEQAPAATTQAPAPSGPPGVQATSLLGESLPAPEFPAAFHAEQTKLLAEARIALEADPDDAEALIWTARRSAYLGRYQVAIHLYTRGIELHRTTALKLDAVQAESDVGK